MRSARKLVVPVVCLGLLVGGSAALAQAIPKALIRLCLRNLATGIACYIVGRGGELIVDGSLSAAWAKAKETVTGEEPEDDGTSKITRPPPATPPFKSPILEPIPPSELGSLSKRLSGLKLAPNDRLTEGFFIYDAPNDAIKVTPKDTPKDASVPLDPSKSLLPRDPITGLPSSLSGSAQPKSLLPEPGLPNLAPAPSGDPYLSPDAYRARNAHRLVPPKTSLTGQFSTFGSLQDECQRRRERETGLSLIAILGAPDFDAQFKRRINEVVAPCMSPRPF